MYKTNFKKYFIDKMFFSCISFVVKNIIFIKLSPFFFLIIQWNKNLLLLHSYTDILKMISKNVIFAITLTDSCTNCLKFNHRVLESTRLLDHLKLAPLNTRFVEATWVRVQTSVKMEKLTSGYSVEWVLAARTNYNGTINFEIDIMKKSSPID